MRLDLYLHLNGYAKSRTNASNLIKLGKVIVNNQTELKPSREVCHLDEICVDQSDNYASLGGIKLKKALEVFKFDVNNKVCIDIGASNGGFTDVLLKAGAKKVFAVDVSECALPNELKDDERVFVRDKLNVRFLNFSDIGIKADLITIDVSFISLKLVIPSIIQFLDVNSAVIALLKPQFEVGRAKLTKSGIVKSKIYEQKAIEDIKEFCKALRLKVLTVTEAPRPFVDKNQEYLLLIV